MILKYLHQIGMKISDKSQQYKLAVTPVMLNMSILCPSTYFVIAIINHVSVSEIASINLQSVLRT
jgi:hypothetical protein